MMGDQLHVLWKFPRSYARLTLIILSAFLASCGGGQSAPPPPAVRASLDYGYFQTADGQLAATSGSVTFLHLQDDSIYGDAASRQWREDQMVARLQEAQTLGPRRAIVSIGYLILRHVQLVGKSSA